MNQHDDQGLIHDIEEDLQRQRLTELWDKYGTFIIVAVFALVLGTAASSGWRSYKQNQNQKASTSLLMITEEAKQDGKVTVLEDFVKEQGSSTQAVLARFFAAQTSLDQGKRERAITFYDALAKDGDVEPVFRGLADLLSVMAQFDTSEPKALEARLQPLSKNGPWQDLAKELIGHLELKAGDKTKAKVVFKDLLNKKDVSPGVQRRAADLHQWLNEKEQ